MLRIKYFYMIQSLLVNGLDKVYKESSEEDEEFEFDWFDYLDWAEGEH
ncbi:MAG: hypothetical protein ACRD8Z_11780 [Nitrososphaeraceae archaeon]